LQKKDNGKVKVEIEAGKKKIQEYEANTLDQEEMDIDKEIGLDENADPNTGGMYVNRTATAKTRANSNIGRKSTAGLRAST